MAEAEKKVEAKVEVETEEESEAAEAHLAALSLSLSSLLTFSMYIRGWNVNGNRNPSCIFGVGKRVSE